jgi:activator of 2-hydroxyglutaryl-CoA dehydratase
MIRRELWPTDVASVFAESEVTGLVHKGEDRGRIARGLHESIARRTLGALKRVGAEGPLVFAGGVARNPAMVALVRAGFDGEVLVPAESQIVGAYGAALSAVLQRA